MRVLSMQLTVNARPLLNSTFIRTDLPGHESFSMEPAMSLSLWSW